MFGACAAASAEKMTTFSRLGTKTSSGVALSGTVDLGKPLTVYWSFPPAPVFTRLVAGSALSLRLREVVDVDILGGGASDDLVPLDGLDVAEVVIVEDANRANENV